MTTLRTHVHVQMGREEETGAAIIESQSITASPGRGQERGDDTGQNIVGRTWHQFVDMQGVILAVVVHAATLSDRDGARMLPRTFPASGPSVRRSRLSWIDHRSLRVGHPDILPTESHEARHTRQVVHGPPVLNILPTDGIRVQRHRWNVERTCGWLIGSRRVAPDSGQAPIQIAVIRLYFYCLTSFPFRCHVVSTHAQDSLWTCQAFYGLQRADHS